MSNTQEKLYAEAYSNLRVDPRDAKSGMSGLHSRYSDYTLTELFENIWSYANIACDSDCDLDTMYMYSNDISWMNEYIKCRLEVQEYVDNALKAEYIIDQVANASDATIDKCYEIKRQEIVDADSSYTLDMLKQMCNDDIVDLHISLCYGPIVDNVMYAPGKTEAEVRAELAELDKETA